MKRNIIEYIEKKYEIVSESPWASHPDFLTFKAKGKDKWFALIMNVSREKLGQNREGNVDIINVKAPEDFIAICCDGEGYFPAYHMNKRHWLSIALDGTLDSKDIFVHIDRSYHMVYDTATDRIYEAVKRIPKGKVASYSQVAGMAGDKNMARAVGNALHKNPDPENIPCFRVVNSKGELSGEFAFGGASAQTKLLEGEGVVVKDGKVDLQVYGISEKEMEDIGRKIMPVL